MVREGFSDVIMPELYDPKDGKEPSSWPKYNCVVVMGEGGEKYRCQRCRQEPYRVRCSWAVVEFRFYLILQIP